MLLYYEEIVKLFFFGFLYICITVNLWSKQMETSQHKLDYSFCLNASF